jgi:multiple sugar transport system ATP-binding protein
MAKVTLRGLTRRHPGSDRPALDRLDLEVVDGELLVVVGPSGCGKSTALRLIAGLDAPDEGAVLLGDRDVTRVPPQDRDVAMVFQGYALYPHMTVRDNLGFPLAMRRVPRPERDKKIAAVVDMLGIGKLLERRPAELSGGERQRVAMGRAIVRDPTAYLFDEPLANLDAALRAELRVDLAALVRRMGTTSLYVTHDQTEAMTMGDRIAVLRAGVLQQIGTPRSIYEDPGHLFVAEFLGSPRINAVAVAREGDAWRGAGATWPDAPALRDQRRAVFAFRPEHVGLQRPDGAAITLEGTVTTVEPLGAESHLTFEAAGVPIRARVAGFDAPRRSETVRAYVAASRLLWFDAAAGQRLRDR